ncbi:MAG: hypothetical protein V3V03_09925, partial [Hyphomonadaceae bacterium]
CACGIDITAKSDRFGFYAYKYFATRSAPQKKAVSRETPWPNDSEITPNLNLLLFNLYTPVPNYVEVKANF